MECSSAYSYTGKAHVNINAVLFTWGVRLLYSFCHWFYSSRMDMIVWNSVCQVHIC
jgi:hypothetical protein